MTTKASIRRSWKRIEQRVAEYIGGRRIPVTGRQRGDAPDIEHNWLSPEVKYRAELPKWLFEARAQSEASARHCQMPIQVYVEKGMQIGDAFVVVRLSDFRDRWL